MLSCSTHKLLTRAPMSTLSPKHLFRPRGGPHRLQLPGICSRERNSAARAGGAGGRGRRRRRPSRSLAQQPAAEQVVVVLLFLRVGDAVLRLDRVLRLYRLLAAPPRNLTRPLRVPQRVAARSALVASALRHVLRQILLASAPLAFFSRGGTRRCQSGRSRRVRRLHWSAGCLGAQGGTGCVRCACWLACGSRAEGVRGASRAASQICLRCPSEISGRGMGQHGTLHAMQKQLARRREGMARA